MNKLYKEDNKKDTCTNINNVHTIVIEMLVHTTCIYPQHEIQNLRIFNSCVKNRAPLLYGQVPGSVKMHKFRELVKTA